MNYLQTNKTIIKNKVGLLNLAEELGNISRACKVMGFSRRGRRLTYVKSTEVEIFSPP